MAVEREVFVRLEGPMGFMSVSVRVQLSRNKLGGTED